VPSQSFLEIDILEVFQLVERDTLYRWHIIRQPGIERF
jgi:hypothetical protein